MTIQEYEKELSSHDWTYAFSDDNRVYQSGSSNESRLIALARANGDAFKRAFNRYHATVFHCEPFVKPWEFPFPEAIAPSVEGNADFGPNAPGNSVDCRP